MQLIGLLKLEKFTKEHAECRKWVSGWVAETKATKWKDSMDIKKRYPTASFLQKNVVIFNVKGNDYRLETIVAYQVGIVTVSWIGTHADYDKRNRRGA